MNRLGARLRAGTAILGIVAIGLLAAIVESIAVPSAGTNGGMTDGAGGVSTEPGTLGLGGLPLFLEVVLVVVAVLVAGLCVLYIVANPLENLVVIGGICVAVAVMFAVILLAGHAFSDEIASYQPQPTEGPPDEETAASDEPGTTHFGLLAYGLVLLGSFVAVFALTLLYTRSTAPALSDSSGHDDPTVAGDAPAAVGAAAGRAADNITAADGTALENEIYRAWSEMTALLPVEHHRSATPGEFVDAAVDAGLDRSDVEELTALFESVRYGDAATTASRERRAVTILRRIESIYGPDEGTRGSE